MHEVIRGYIKPLTDHHNCEDKQFMKQWYIDLLVNSKSSISHHWFSLTFNKNLINI